MAPTTRDKISEIYDQLSGEEEETATPTPEEVEVTEEPEQEVESAPEPVQPEAEEEEPVIEQVEPDNNIDALMHPPSLNNDEKALFDALPDRKSKRLVKDVIARRDLQYKAAANRYVHKLNTAFNEQVEKFKGLDKVAKTHQDYLEDNALSLEEVADNALAWDKAFADNPVQAAIDLLQSHGITPQMLMQGHTGNLPVQPQRQVEIPEFREIKTELQQLKEAKRQSIISTIDKDIDTFVNATDANGQRVYPLVDYVETDMAERVPLLKRKYPQANNFQLLHAAYEEAVWANPQTRELALNSVKSLQKKVPAKKATSLSSKASGDSVTKKSSQAKTDREIVEDAWEQLTNS